MTHSKVPPTIEEMRDIRFLIDVLQRHVAPNNRKIMQPDIEWALYTLDHAMECPIEE